MENEDPHIYATTVREAMEETGIDLDQETSYIGRLSDLSTVTHDRKYAMVLTPFLFRLEKEPEWRLNSEVKEKMWVPLAFFMDLKNRKKMDWELGGETMALPCYDYQNRRIWGLTLAMLDELVGVFRCKESECDNE